MPRVSVVTLDQAKSVADVAGYRGRSPMKAYFQGEQSPLHLQLHELAPGQVLQIETSDVDRIAYVWDGGVSIDGCDLPQGSSAIVEHGVSLDVVCGQQPTRLLTFAAASAASQRRAGGHAHLLPAERVPRTAPLSQSSGVSGGMHANSACPTCELWLHENHFPGREGMSREEEARGIHSHTEDEIIFVTAGQIRLGGKVLGPGTALAIAANTLYSFTAGPEGLSFINFRAHMPGDIRFANGSSMNEVAYWQERVSNPQYVEIRGS